MNPPLPNDRDLRLAERLADGPVGLASDSDSMADVLRAAGAAYRAKQIDSRSGARMWAAIDRATRVGSDRRPVRSQMRLVWGTVAVAAAVVVLILLPTIPRAGTAQLLAEASADQLRFVTDDGSAVTLRPNSRLYREVEEHTFRLEGEAFFEVTRNPDRVFRVIAGTETIEVLGTRFNALAVEGFSRVFLEEGSVRLIAGVDSVLLNPGETVSVRGGAIPVKSASDGREDTDWLRGELVFTSRSVGEVAAELGRHFQVRLDIPEGTGQERLSGRILLSGQEDALRDFALVVGGRFVPVGDGLRFIPE